MKRNVLSRLPGLAREAVHRALVVMLWLTLLAAQGARCEVGNGVSGLFTVDTRYGFSLGAGISGFFTVDTRFYQLDPPYLAAEKAGTNIIFSWPATASGYSVESSASLTAPAWAPLTNVPVLSGMRQYVTNSITAQSRYYRLQRE